MARTVRAAADYKLPTGQLMTPGAVVIEEAFAGTNNTHYDTPHAWAMFLNSLYEHFKPTVINDAPAAPWTSSGADTWHEIGRYRVPLFQVGTGDASEGIAAMVWYKVAAADTAFVRMTTPLGTYTSGAMNSAVMAWETVTLGSSTIDDSLPTSTASAEVIFEAKCTADGSNLSAYALQAYWYRASATLPGVLYDVAFIPMDDDELDDEGDGVHVEQMLRMARNAVYIKQHRTAGTILMSALRNYFVVPGAGAGLVVYSIARTIAFQPEGATTARFYFYGVLAGAGSGLVTVSIGDQVRTGGTAQATIPGVLGWAYCDVDIPAHHGPIRELMVEITATTASAGGAGETLSILSICGWWLPITEDLS